jgi:activator of 2-hydroxyglutaryl-CoA dehydratase
MRAAGIDIGSRSIELVVIEKGVVTEKKQADTGYDPMAVTRDLIDGVAYDSIVATGYGRNLFEVARSEERRVGKECRRLCRSRWSPYH